MDRKTHWETIYSTKSDDEVSWTQSDPEISLKLIQEATSGGRLVDVGSGTSVLIERLLQLPYRLTVLDISQAALNRAMQRLGDRASQIKWLTADVTTVEEIGTFDVWHDRAVFHFLTEPTDRRKYINLAARSIPAGGHLIIGTFALNGPEKCSGLIVERYDGKKLIGEFGEFFNMKKEFSDSHTTPWGKSQLFYYAILERNDHLA